MVTIPKIIEFPDPSSQSLGPSEQAVLRGLQTRWYSYLERLTDGIVPFQVSRVAGQHRAAFRNLLTMVWLTVAPQHKQEEKVKETLEGPQEQFVERVEQVAQHASFLSAPERRQFQSAVESYRAYMEWLFSQDWNDERLQKVVFDVMDAVTEFEMVAMALKAAAAGEIRWQQANLNALARFADRAMVKVEDIFLAEWAAQETYDEEKLVSLEEIKKKLGV